MATTRSGSALRAAATSIADGGVQLFQRVRWLPANRGRKHARHDPAPRRCTVVKRGMLGRDQGGGIAGAADIGHPRVSPSASARACRWLFPAGRPGPAWSSARSSFKSSGVVGAPIFRNVVVDRCGADADRPGQAGDLAVGVMHRIPQRLHLDVAGVPVPAARNFPAWDRRSGCWRCHGASGHTPVISVVWSG